MLEVAEERYRLVREAKVYHVPVDDPLTARFAHAVHDFTDRLAARDELGGDWGDVARRAAAAARALWTVPLEASDPPLRLGSALEILEQRARVVKQVHGEDIAAAVDEAVAALGEIVGRGVVPVPGCRDRGAVHVDRPRPRHPARLGHRRRSLVTVRYRTRGARADAIGVA